MSSRDLCPKDSAAEMNGREVGFGAFGIARGNAAPLFESQESIFDEVSQLVEIGIIVAQLFAICLGRNDHLDSGVLGFINNRIGIVAFVREQTLGMETPDQFFSLRAIRHGTRRNKYSDRHTMRIHGQMYFCISPPFVRPMASFPPLAPLAWACAFT